MVEPILPLDGLLLIEKKGLVARLDGGDLSSDSGLLVLGEVERRLGVADRPAQEGRP